MPALSTVQLDVVENHINKYVTKNNSRSLSGVIKSSSVLKFGMVANSTTLISQFSDFISKTGSFG